MQIAIAIDDWKLSIFERHLAQSGYTYKTGPGLTSDMMILYVVTDNAVALGEVVRAANLEARLTIPPEEGTMKL
jgi:hypothetical protein